MEPENLIGWVFPNALGGLRGAGNLRRDWRAFRTLPLPAFAVDMLRRRRLAALDRRSAIAHAGCVRWPKDRERRRC